MPRGIPKFKRTVPVDSVPMPSTPFVECADIKCEDAKSVAPSWRLKAAAFVSAVAVGLATGSGWVVLANWAVLALFTMGVHIAIVLLAYFLAVFIAAYYSAMATTVTFYFIVGGGIGKLASAVASRWRGEKASFFVTEVAPS